MVGAPNRWDAFEPGEIYPLICVNPSWFKRIRADWRGLADSYPSALAR